MDNLQYKIGKSSYGLHYFVERLSYALNFAKRTIAHCIEEYQNYSKDSNEFPKLEKIIGETTYLMLSSAFSSEAYVEIRKQLAELADILIPYARNEKTLLNICLYPSIALDFAIPHICLTKLGYYDSKFDALLTKAITAHAHLGRERLPHRIIEQKLFKKAINKDKHSIDEIMSYSSLANPIDLLHGTTDDMYAFTHSLMYASDFNSNFSKLPRSRREILNEAEAMLAKCIDQENYDLAGELILSWSLTNSPWTAVPIFAFLVLTHVEDKVGFLPSPGIGVEDILKLEGDQKKQYLFNSAYHTIFVMGLLCSAILKSGKIPPRKVPANKAMRGSASMIMPYLHNENQPQWLKVFESLGEVEQDSIASFLLSVAIIRTVQGKKYERVYHLLELGSKLGLINTPIARQAAELLERLGLLSHYLN